MRRAAQTFTWEKLTFNVGWRWLPADISKFLPMEVSCSWKNLSGQPWPWPLTKLAHSRKGVRDTGSFPRTFPRGHRALAELPLPPATILRLRGLQKDQALVSRISQTADAPLQHWCQQQARSPQ